MDLSLFRKSLSGPVGSRKASPGAAGLHIDGWHVEDVSKIFQSLRQDQNVLSKSPLLVWAGPCIQRELGILQRAHPSD